MKFEIKTTTLKKAIDSVMHAVSNVVATPILENILIKVNYNNIVLTSNNLEMAIEYVIDEDFKIDLEWSICIPSKIFSNYINFLKDDFLTIDLLDNNTISIQTLSSVTKIKWNSSSDFPLIPTIKENKIFNLKSNILKKAIEKTIFSAAEWSIRPALAWIYCNINWNELSFATTDSFRLTEYKIDLDKNIIDDYTMIIPSKTSYELKSMLEDNIEIKVITSDNQIVFSFWSVRFYSRLLNWQFPNYKWFFPTNYNTKSIINKQDLINSLKKINLLSRENNYSIKINFLIDQNILIESSQTEIWEAKAYLVWATEWEESTVWLNWEYLLQVLSIIDTTHVSISFESNLSPILISPVNDDEKITNSSYRHIIMPLKI